MPDNISSGMLRQGAQFTDPKTGIITREWYNFLFNLFTLAGGGQFVSNLAVLQAAVDKLEQAPVVPSLAPMVINTVPAVLNFPSTAANSSSTLTVTVPGAVDGDMVRLCVPNAAVPTQGAYFAWVSALSTVSVRFINNTAAAVDPASATFKIIVERY